LGAKSGGHGWMKTFKLKDLRVIENKNDTFRQHHIPLIDGLIINREEEQNRWVIEAYMKQDRLAYFNRLKEQGEQIMVQVTITKESNPPATFITSIIGINEIARHMNVLLIGKIVDQRKDVIEKRLKNLIDEGYSGEDLLEKFKESL